MYFFLLFLSLVFATAYHAGAASLVAQKPSRKMLATAGERIYVFRGNVSANVIFFQKKPPPVNTQEHKDTILTLAHPTFATMNARSLLSICVVLGVCTAPVSAASKKKSVCASRRLVASLKRFFFFFFTGFLQGVS